MMTYSAKTGEVTCEDERPSSITPASSWTHQHGESEAKREHDFDNWLQELVYASESGDSKMVAFVSGELRQLYKSANRQRGEQGQS